MTPGFKTFLVAVALVCCCFLVAVLAAPVN